MEYSFGPVVLAKRSVWPRFIVDKGVPVKIMAQTRGKPWQDVELTLEEMAVVFKACETYLADISQSEQQLLFGDFKVFLQETLERIPNKELKIEGIPEFRDAAKKLLEVLNG